MAFVTVNCAPLTVGDWVESIQVTGGIRLSEDCSVNPTAFVGHERMSSTPMVRAFKYGSSGVMALSATVCRDPAAIAVTPLKT